MKVQNWQILGNSTPSKFRKLLTAQPVNSGRTLEFESRMRYQLSGPSLAPDLFEPVHHHIQPARRGRWIGPFDDHNPAVAREVEVGRVLVEEKLRRACRERR